MLFIFHFSLRKLIVKRLGVSHKNYDGLDMYRIRKRVVHILETYRICVERRIKYCVRHLKSESKILSSPSDVDWYSYFALRCSQRDATIGILRSRRMECRHWADIVWRYDVCSVVARGTRVQSPPFLFREERCCNFLFLGTFEKFTSCFAGIVRYFTPFPTRRRNLPCVPVAAEGLDPKSTKF